MKENKWTIVVCGVLKYNDDYLIVQRKKDDDNSAGFWEFPSGRAEFGEKILQTLQREVLEETGYDISRDSYRLVGISEYLIEKPQENRHTIQLNYLVDLKILPEIKLSNEHIAFDWVKAKDSRLDEFLLKIIDNIKW